MRKFLIGLLVFILINTVGLLILSYTIKDILRDGIIKEIIINQVSLPDFNDGNYQYRNNITTDENIDKITDDERIKELLKSDEVNELIDKYLDIVVEGLIDEEKLDEVELEKDIMKYLRENKDKLEKITGKEITDEQLDQFEEELKESDIDTRVKETITETSKSIPKESKEVLKWYKAFISFKFRLILLITSIVDLLLIAILQKSTYKWIKILAITLITNGIFAIIVGGVVYLIIYALTKVKFNISSLLITGIIITIVGVIMRIMYGIFTKNIENKEVITNEIS